MEEIIRSPESIKSENRPWCYWGWLENITPAETRRQIDLMAEAGLGGYVMHARGGLTIPYAGRQWMDSVRAMVDEGRKRNMTTVVDDEHGWPSGFGAGRVNGMGEAYQLKYLLSEAVSAADAVGLKGTLGLWRLDDFSPVADANKLPGDVRVLRVYRKADPYYVDNMDAKVVDAFLACSYGEYEREVGGDFGRGVFGVFSDEPQTARYATPWSDTLPALFEARYGYPLLPELYKVFADVPGCEALRNDFYRLMQGCFSENYAGRIGRWCEQRGLAFLGHTCIEEHFVGQLRCAVGTMPFYWNMTIPGIDWLGRGPCSDLAILQMTSVARQAGKERALCEMFGCAGWNVSFEELKWIAQKQMMMGVDLQLQHLGLYSLRGSRKREYPASLFRQQPWYSKYRAYNDYFAVIGQLIRESAAETDLLLIHPMYSVFVTYNGEENSCDAIQADFDGLLHRLLMSGIFPDLGDETLLGSHGRVEGARLVLGCQSYETVLLPRMKTIGSQTVALLRAFVEAGGRLLTLSDPPALADGRPARIELNARRIDESELRAPAHVRMESGANESVYLTRRSYMGRRFYYLVNNDLRRAADFTLERDSDAPLAAYDPLANAFEPFADGPIHMEGGEALLLWESSRRESAARKKEDGRRVRLGGRFALTRATANALTLDHCRPASEDGAFGCVEYVPDIQARLMREALNRDVRLKFEFQSEFDTDASLLLEERGKTKVTVNGEELTAPAIGWQIDPCFEELPIRVRSGKNEIVLERAFWNSPRVYEVKNSRIHEAEANRVTVETELESVYIWGDFGVYSDTPLRGGPRGTAAAEGSFTLRPRPAFVDPARLTHEGFPFFAGSMTLRKEAELPSSFGGAVFCCARPDAIVTEVSINGGDAARLMWAPWKAEVGGLPAGGTTVEITLTNSLRNLLGPHYSREGEPYSVGPGSFGKECEGKHFVEFGIRDMELVERL